MRNRWLTTVTGWRRRAARAVGPGVALACGGLSACAGDGDPVAKIALDARLDDRAGRIVARIDGLRPAERVGNVRLVGPRGKAFAAESRMQSRGVAATHGEPTIGVQARGGSASGIEPGLTLSLDLFDWSWGGSDTVSRRGVTAAFAVPDAFRDTPTGWRVEAVVTDPAGGSRTYRAPVAVR